MLLTELSHGEYGNNAKFFLVAVYSPLELHEIHLDAMERRLAVKEFEPNSSQSGLSNDAPE